MKKLICNILMGVLLVLLLPGCSKKKEIPIEVNVEQPAAEIITEEQAILAIRNYCVSNNPDLENIMNEGEYPVYWEVLSSDDNEIVVLFRSYTGAQNRYYINRHTGDTYVTEFVPGIMDEEERTDEQFNVLTWGRS